MTMRHLTLICMAGISTSLLVNKMKRLIRNENLEIAVTAMSERAFQGYTGQTDVLLLGPQLGHRFESLKEQYKSKGIRIDRECLQKKQKLLRELRLQSLETEKQLTLQD